MINYNESDHHLDTTLIDLRLDMGAFTLINIKKCLSMMRFICIKEHPTNLKVQFMKKLKSTEDRLKKMSCL